MFFMFCFYEDFNGFLFNTNESIVCQFNIVIYRSSENSENKSVNWAEKIVHTKSNKSFNVFLLLNDTEIFQLPNLLLKNDFFHDISKIITRHFNEAVACQVKYWFNKVYQYENLSSKQLNKCMLKKGSMGSCWGYNISVWQLTFKTNLRYNFAYILNLVGLLDVTPVVLLGCLKVSMCLTILP